MEHVRLGQVPHFAAPLRFTAEHETFDPKPHAPQKIRGEFAPVSTSVSGVQLSEGLPEIADVVDRLKIVRSMTHPYPVHCTAYVTSAIPGYTLVQSILAALFHLLGSDTHPLVQIDLDATCRLRERARYAARYSSFPVWFLLVVAS